MRKIKAITYTNELGASVCMALYLSFPVMWLVQFKILTNFPPPI